MNSFIAEVLAIENVQRHDREKAALENLYKMKSRRFSRYNFLEMIKKVRSRRKSSTLRKPNFQGIPAAINFEDIFRKPIKGNGC